MGKKLFVGGLPYSVDDAQLNELFSRVGEVESAQVITDKFSGQSKGFGFVEMVSDDAAAKAIQQLNETQLSGRNIVVNEARPKEDRPFGGRPDRGDRGPRDNNSWRR